MPVGSRCRVPDVAREAVADVLRPAGIPSATLESTDPSSQTPREAEEGLRSRGSNGPAHPTRPGRGCGP